MSPEPTLRPLRPDDAAAAASLIRSAFAAQPVATDPPSSALRETADSVRSWIAADGGTCATEAGSLLALLLWAERDGGLYCGRLAVDPAARGRGLARALMAEAEREARRRALPRLHVRVRLQLAANLALFASLGYREIAREAHAGHAGPTLSIMEKRLDG